MKSSYKIIIYPKAQLDIESIFKYIYDSLSNPQAAFLILDEFYKAFNNLRFFPEAYPKISNEYVNDKDIRKIIVKNYLVFYRIKENEIQIIRVLYGTRDYQNLL